MTMGGPRRRGSLAVTYAVIGAGAVVLAFPFLWMLITAFKSDRDLYNPDNVPLLFNDPPTLEHVRRLFADTPYLQWWWNTICVGVAVTAITLGLAIPAAYALTRHADRSVRRAGRAMFFAYLVPPTVLFLPLARAVSSLGLHDSLWALILIYPSFTVPCASWLLMAFFKAVPRELEESALLDGCSIWSVLIRVVVPAAKGGILAVGIFTFGISSSEFTYALTFITSSAHKTLAVGVPSDLIRGDTAYWGSLMAGTVGASLVLGAAYALALRHFAGTAGENA